MKPLKSYSLRTLLLIWACYAHSGPHIWAQNKVDALLARLSEKPLNRAVLWQIEAQPDDPKTLPALRAAFEKREIKEERQWLAVTLLRLGDRSDIYLNFLARFVKEAIEDRSPLWERFDPQGRFVRGQFSAEFENWCALNNKDPKQVASLQFGTYPKDVMMLALAEDPRSIPLFKRGLESHFPGVVAYSVQGLGRLRVVDAIPSVSAAIDRMPSGERGAVAAQLPWYRGAEAERLLEHLEPSTDQRNYLRHMVQMQRDDELQRTQSRQGRPALK